MSSKKIIFFVALTTFLHWGISSFSQTTDQDSLIQSTKKKLKEAFKLYYEHPEEAMRISKECNALAHSISNSDLLAESYNLRGTVEGELNLGIIPTVASNLLSRVIPSLLEKYPGVTLNIQEITTANITAKLKSNELVAGIVSTPLEIQNLEEVVLYYEKLLVYGHSLSTIEKYQSPSEIIHEKVWLLEEGNCLTDQIINVCDLSAKKINSNLNFHPSSFESLLSIVDSMKGLTLIPELYYLDLSDEKKRFVKDFITPFPVREISMVYYRPYAKQKLIAIVAEEIKQIIKPLLETTQLRANEMMIARM